MTRFELFLELANFLIGILGLALIAIPLILA